MLSTHTYFRLLARVAGLNLANGGLVAEGLLINSAAIIGGSRVDPGKSALQALRMTATCCCLRPASGPRCGAMTSKSCMEFKRAENTAPLKPHSTTARAICLTMSFTDTPDLRLSEPMGMFEAEETSQSCTSRGERAVCAIENKLTRGFLCSALYAPTSGLLMLG